MARLTNGTATVTLVALVGLLWLADDAVARMAYGAGRGSHRRPGPSATELVFEGSLAEPLGTQADAFGSGAGLGAGTGYELGVRVRQHLSDRIALSPTFHYVAFGMASGVADFPEGADLGYEVATSLHRYGLDLQVFGGSAGGRLRPFLTGGAALSHNRYRDSLQGYQDFRTAMNGPSWNAGVGLKAGGLEISAVYHWNRFTTANLTAGAAQRDYDWDYAVLRAGFAFGSR